MNNTNYINDIRDHGFTFIPNFLSDTEQQALLSSVKEHATKAEKNFGTSKNKEITLAMFRTPKSKKAMRNIVFGQKLNGILSPFISKPFVDHTKILVKAVGGPDTPWHQDGAFWEDFDPQKSMLSLWLALEDVTIKNGCMELIKPQKGAIKTDHTHKEVREGKELEIPEETIQEILQNASCEKMEMKAGDALIFDSRAIHRALPNQDENPRIGMKIVFQDLSKRNLEYPRHKSSIDMCGWKGMINRVANCAVTARRV